jgi:hypothetical protein
MLDTIREAWGWIGLDPAEVVAENAFGNLIVRATGGAYWRICPEELSCERVARDAEEFAALFRREEFRTDWEMARLVEQAPGKARPAPGRPVLLPQTAGRHRRQLRRGQHGYDVASRADLVRGRSGGADQGRAGRRPD